jgi:transposase
MLPTEYPPKSTVHRYFLEWQFAGVWGNIQRKLHGMAREELKRKAEPAAAIIDAQTVKSGLKGGMLRPIARDMTAARITADASGTARSTHKG